jgi:hypothetical protein
MAPESYIPQYYASKGRKGEVTTQKRKVIPSIEGELAP